MKYVRIDAIYGRGKNKTTRALVVAFPNDLIHEVVARHMQAAVKEQWPGWTAKIVSGGDADVMMYATGGKSETLKKPALPGDAKLFNNSDYSGHVS